MIQDGLVSLLKADPEVNTLSGGRIYPVVLVKDATYPAISYQDISQTSQTMLQGEGQVTKRLQFDCWAQTYKEVKQLQAALCSALLNFSGTLPDGRVIQTTVSDVAQDFFENETLLFRTSNDFLFIGNNL